MKVRNFGPVCVFLVNKDIKRQTCVFGPGSQRGRLDALTGARARRRSFQFTCKQKNDGLKKQLASTLASPGSSVPPTVLRGSAGTGRTGRTGRRAASR